jgi:mannitol-specific phosphotransferase system IIBC component
MWFLFQSTIIFAVMASNIHWHWTPNGYLAGLIGAVLAYGVTVLLSYSLLKIKRTSESR